MQEKIKEKHNEIARIQNEIWTMYKDFLSNRNMKEYNRKMGELVREYQDKGDKQLLSFCQNLLVTWAPIINWFAEELIRESQN